MRDLRAKDSGRYNVRGLCVLFGKSKQAYYQYDEDLALGKAAREEFALEYIRGVRASDPGIGGVKLWHMYRKEFSCDGPIGRDRFCRIIDENRLKVRQRRRKPRTTDSTHGLPTYPNLVKDFIPLASNRLWVSDITYIQVMDGACGYHFCYLSLILDAYSEEIVGWSVGPTLDTEYPIAALRMALKRIEGKDVSLIHHSDRGISMTESGDPKENAQAERINNTMKNELLKGKVFRSLDEVVAATALAVDFYNNRRPHMSVGMMTPAEASGTTGDRDLRWKSYRMLAIKSRNNSDISENPLPLPERHGSPSDLRSSVNP